MQPSLQRGGGVDGAIRDMEKELQRYFKCEIGDCVLTMGQAVTNVDYVFDTVGPNLKRGTDQSRKQKEEQLV